MRSFVKSVLAGALSSAAPLMLITTVVASFLLYDDTPPANALWLAVLPLAITLPVVLACSLLIGLPLTALLRRLRRESEIAYVAVGVAAGVLAPVLVLGLIGAPSGWWIGLLGGLGGFVTARTWWRDAREPVVRADLAND